MGAKAEKMRNGRYIATLVLAGMMALCIAMPEWAQAQTQNQRLATGQTRNHVQPRYQPSSPLQDESRSQAQSPSRSQRDEQKQEQSRPETPVDMAADNLSYDQKGQRITASGNVELVRGERILRAEKVSYDLEKDIVRASGDVVLVAPDGEVTFADNVKLEDRMKHGFAKKIRVILMDGSRLKAARGEHIADDKTVMHDASYTACKPCAKNPEAAPVWRISADKVTHDKESRTVAYENATLDFFGLPVLYTPYFQHPDGTIDRKSGFLLPGIGSNSTLGASIHNRYYWNIAPSLDATLGAELYTKEIPRGTLEVRKRFANADLQLRGSLTESERAGVDDDEEEVRGHLFGAGQWHLDKNWRTGFQLETSSDDQFLRQYNVTSRDVLENELYAERFDSRNYFGARLLNFQDVRVSDRDAEQPDVLPEIETQLVSPHDQLLGGRLGLDASFLALRRDEDKRELNRVSAGPSWSRRFVSDHGLVSSLEFSARGDVFDVSDDPTIGGDGDDTETRIYPYAHYEARYPLANQLHQARLVVTPRASITLAPDVENDNLPNEDSRDVQLDAANLFQPNRFPGLDRVEDGAHTAYGLESGIYRPDGSRLEALIGQSRRLDDVIEAENPFPEGSGLADDVGDFVGEITGQYKSKASLQYRFQFDGKDLADKRHELDADAHLANWDLSTSYLFASSLANTDITNTREQLSGDIGYRLNEQWRVTTGAVHDFGKDSGLRQAELGIAYSGQCGQCLTISGTFQRNLVDDVTGESETEFLLEFGLRNLGSFRTSGIGISDSQE